MNKPNHNVAIEEIQPTQATLFFKKYTHCLIPYLTLSFNII